MQIAFIIIHILVCIGLILVVLLQAGKGANMGAAFGGSSQTIFGSSGPGTFLSKITTAIAIIFMITSLGLSYFATQKGTGTMMKKVSTPAPVQQQQPVTAPTAMPGQTGQPAAPQAAPATDASKAAAPAAQPVAPPAKPAAPVK